MIDWQRVDDIEARAAKATTGAAFGEVHPDCVAAAREDVPWLCEQLREVREVMAEAVKTLESFAADWGKVAGEDRVDAVIDDLRDLVSPSGENAAS